MICVFFCRYNLTDIVTAFFETSSIRTWGVYVPYPWILDLWPLDQCNNIAELRLCQLPDQTLRNQWLPLPVTWNTYSWNPTTMLPISPNNRGRGPRGDTCVERNRPQAVRTDWPPLTARINLPAMWVNHPKVGFPASNQTTPADVKWRKVKPLPLTEPSPDCRFMN